jgi:hypothetical protein
LRNVNWKKLIAIEKSLSASVYRDRDQVFAEIVGALLKIA